MVIIFAFLLSSPVINEVMYNPAGPESGAGTPGDRNEFIEIYNSANVPVDLRGCHIADLQECDSIIPYPDSSILDKYPSVILNTTVVPPRGFALILDPEYVAQCTLYPQPYNIPEGTVILSPHDTDIGNGLSENDRIYLISPAGDTLDSYPGSISSPDGFSVERRDPNAPGTPDNWRVSLSGSTPGSINSVSRKAYFTVIPNSVLTIPEDPEPGNTIVLKFLVHNCGLEALRTLQIQVNINDNIFSDELEFDVPPEDTGQVELNIGSFPEGYFNMVLNIVGRTATDSFSFVLNKTLRVGIGPVIINEIMYDDSAEWVEIYNRTTKSIDLAGMRIKDMTSRESSPFSPFELVPGEYRVITADFTKFKDRFPECHCVDSIGEMPTLNNSHETVFLIDSTGTILDAVEYRSSWGGNSGRSLERLSPQVSSKIRSNWATCQDPQGGTPCMRNSISVESNTSKILALSCAILSKSTGKAITISYSLPEGPSKAKVIIFDSMGRVVRRLFSGDSPTGSGTILFDGRDDSGSFLPVGLYIIYFEGKTPRRFYKRKKTLVIRD